MRERIAVVQLTQSFGVERSMLSILTVSVYSFDCIASRYFSDFQDMNHIGLKNGAEAPRLVTLKRSKAGFGFQMRGANCK